MSAVARFRTLAAVVLFLCAPLAAADWAADEAEIRRVFTASMDAFNAGDLDGHLKVYDESVVFVTRDGPRVGIAPIEEAFRDKYFKDGKAIQQLAFEEVKVRQLAPGAALTTARWKLAGGGVPDQAGWFTVVWQRTPEGWRIVHDHTT
jgi:beta-aspartyl-peptidase (threonine type)